MPNAQKDTHAHTQTPGFIRPSETTIQRDAIALAKRVTGFSRGPFVEMTFREGLRWTIAFRMAKALSAEQRDDFLKQFRKLH